VSFEVLPYSLARVRAALALVSQLQTSEFPQPNCRDGIQLIAEMLQARLTLAEAFNEKTSPEIVDTACHELLDTLFELLPILGFFLRSTNVRNAFEFHAPVARLVRQLVPNFKLVLSSEWNFSPFTYPQMVSLPNYVLIGLPASESANALALPLAGHEIGHAVWEKESLGKEFRPRIVQALLKEIRGRWDEYRVQFPHVTHETLEDLYSSRTWTPAFKWAASQVEECFCDNFGVRIFGESYLHAFAYLLAPGLAARNPLYPSNQRRAENLVTASERWGLHLPDEYVSNFRDWPSSLEVSAKFLCSLADSTANSVNEDLLEKCDTIATDAGVLPQNHEEVSNIVAAFRKLVPGTGARALSNIINAGWQAFHDPALWSDYPHIKERRAAVLNEIVLKTVEVFEIEAVLRGE